MRISGINANYIGVAFGTISESDKKRAIREGYKEKEIAQAEAMRNFHYYYTKEDTFRVRLEKELRQEDAKSSLELFEDYLEDEITPDDLEMVISGLQRVQNRENGIRPEKLENVDYDDYGDGDR